MQSTSSRLDMPLGEAMFTQRSIRKFKSDPIADEDIRTMLEAAAKAPNGGNRQPGRFLVLTERETIRQFGALYREAWWAKRRDEGQPWTSLEQIPPEQVRRPVLRRHVVHVGPGNRHRLVRMQHPADT